MSRRPYMHKLPKWWWLKPGRYLNYMIRELSCVFIGTYTLVIVAGLMRLSEGRAQYEAFLEMLKEPLWIAFHVLALLFALIHTVTWFGLTPKAMPLWIGESRVPGAAIVAVHYVGWIVVSGVVLYLAGVL